MIVTRLKCGLGNQLFQYAVGRCLAYKHNTELKFDMTIMNRGKNSHHAFYRLNNFNVIENIATDEEIKPLTVLREKYIRNPDEIINAPDNVYLWGFWGNEKYFSEIRDILLREFTLKNPLGKISSVWAEMIRAAKCPVCVHVRHGDYISYSGRDSFGMIYPEYYFACVNELKKFFSDITVFVFSDDLEWCKENLKFDVPAKFVEGCEYDFEEMYLMSLCHHNIIPNSTFSWWGAWLNQNPNKKVFLPDPIRPNAIKGAGVIPENWTTIHAEFNVNFSPMLSIIFYAENNDDNLKLSINSILSQNLKDYEVIFVSTAEDDKLEIARQFMVQKNFTVLTVNRHTTKFAAWNKGLEVACGDYVLFLSDKDFIFPHAANFLAYICDGSYRHPTYSELVKKCPDIICTNKFLEEDVAGTHVISGLGLIGKKFSLKVDAELNKINAVVEVNIPDNLKLMFLATQRVNILVGTKFFKRSFLTENNIRYTARGAEILFLVNAFMATEKITFMPYFFSGRLK